MSFYCILFVLSSIASCSLGIISGCWTMRDVQLQQHQSRARMHACIRASVPSRSLWRWGKLKYKDGRCRSGCENCNFCRLGSRGWQEIFHPCCHRRINKTSGAESGPCLSFSLSHTHTSLYIYLCEDTFDIMHSPAPNLDPPNWSRTSTRF